MRHARFSFILIGIMFSLVSYGQKKIIKQADNFFKAKNFDEAVKLYNQIGEIAEKEDLLFKRGVSNYHCNKLDEAIRDFSMARNLGYEDNDIYLYAARALHSRGSYLDATQFYKNYLRYLNDKKEEAKIVELIKQCKFGYNNQFNDQLAFVENLGSGVNTEYDEWNPVHSPSSQNKYYFSSNRSGSIGGLRNKNGFKDEIYGNYFADMYAVELSNGNWTPVAAFNPILNGPKNDMIQGFNPDGSVLYFLKTQDGVSGEMYADTFSIDKDPDAFPKKLKSPVVSELGDKDLQVFNNETIIFSSRRTGGYGGYDLYVTYKQDGEWTNPTNLGPEVNSEYNEITPFLSKSGKKIFFSSDRLTGFGGYDIFYSEYGSTSNEWSIPVNLGAPINSTLDDKNYSLSSDGMIAIFSSDRVGSLGGSDLYLAYHKEQITDQLMYTETLPFIQYTDDLIGEVISDATEVEEIVKTGDIPEEVVKKDFYNEPLYYGSDEIILTPANKSKLNRVKDILTVYPEVSIILTGHSIKEGLREFDLYFSIKRAEKAAEYLINNGISTDRIKVRGLGSNFPQTKQNGSRLSEKNNKRIDVCFIKVPSNRLNVINEMPAVSDALMDGASERYYNTLKGLAYKIQIAQTKQMFKGDIIRQSESGVVEKEYASDDYTYTVGVFDRYYEAKQLKSSLLRQGIIEAKVIPYMNDVKLSTEQVEVLKDVYPDLREYLNFER